MSPKSEPFTLRLSSSLNEFVTDEARRTRRSKGSVVESLAEEALRTRLFPGIAFRGAGWERRPWVIGSTLDVWEIVRAYQDFGSTEQMVQETDVTGAQLGLAISYYSRFADEIDEIIADSRRSLQALHAEFPTIDRTFV